MNTSPKYVFFHLGAVAFAVLGWLLFQAASRCMRAAQHFGSRPEERDR
jgi:hypothetical protein